MSKVQITVSGKPALVDADQVQLLQQKEALISQANAIKSRASELSAVEALIEMDKIVNQIIQLNRKIRSNVQFI